GTERQRQAGNPLLSPACCFLWHFFRRWPYKVSCLSLALALHVFEQPCLGLLPLDWDTVELRDHFLGDVTVHGHIGVEIGHVDLADLAAHEAAFTSERIQQVARAQLFFAAA